MSVWAATGHRPEKLGGYNPTAAAGVIAAARMAVTWAAPSKVLVGMALGWDTAVAIACKELGVPYIACVPFEGQESRWNTGDQAKFRWLLESAAQVVHVSPPGYSAAKMEIRNRYMVDNTEKVMALWDGEQKGGTANCVRYALPRRQVCNWWRLYRQLVRGEIDPGPWQSPNFPMDVPF